MRYRLRSRIRVWLIGACLVASVPLLWRAPEVAADLRRDRRAAEIYQRGAGLHMSGRYVEAAEAYRAVLEVSPRAIEAFGALADVESRLGRVDEAVAVYRRLLAIYPYSYVGALYREVGLIELRAGRFSEARRDLAQAVELDPQDWLASYLLGHAHRRLGDRAAARAAWMHVVALYPDYRPVHDQLRTLGQ